MGMDKKFLIWGLSFAAVGLSLGIYMAASGIHAELVTHTHILLIGFLLSFVYGLIHRLWLDRPARGVSNIQFVVHQAAAVATAVGLFLGFGGFIPMPKLEPALGVASIGVLFSMLLMIFMVLRFGAGKTAEAG